MATCGSDGASSQSVASPPESISAQVCIEGNGREASLYARNLNDFSSERARLSIDKGGPTYLLGVQAEHVGRSRWRYFDRPPESIRPTGPFVDPGEFTTRAQGVLRETDLLVLASFNHVSAVTIEIEARFEAE